jgi:hypothetical protein
MKNLAQSNYSSALQTVKILKQKVRKYLECNKP